MAFSLMRSEQIRVVTNAQQVFHALENLREHDQEVSGSMHWRERNGTPYLYRVITSSQQRRRREISLGPQSDKTRQIQRAFEERKAEHLLRRHSFEEQVELNAGYVRLNGVNRVPTTAARVIRALQHQGIPFRIVGTNALYAFEMAGGALFEQQHLATDDLDVLFDARRGSQIIAAIDPGNQGSFLKVLQMADKSFRRDRDWEFEYSAVNERGYRVDLITQGHTNPMKESEFNRQLNEGDLQPSTVRSQRWLVSSPRFDAVVFDEQGYPLRMRTVDPRAFVLHKYYMSEDPARGNLKSIRDEVQAAEVATLVAQRLPQLPAGKAIERIFPHTVRQQVAEKHENGPNLKF